MVSICEAGAPMALADTRASAGDDSHFILKNVHPLLQSTYYPELLSKGYVFDVSSFVFKIDGEILKISLRRDNCVF